MKKTILLLSVLSFAFVKANNYHDSLRSVLQTSSSDSVKTMAYNALFYGSINEPVKALEIISEAKLFCSGISDQRNKAFCMRKIGTFYHRLNYFDKALECYINASDMFSQIDDKEGLANCYNNIGNAYASKGELTNDVMFYDRAIEYHLKCMALRREVDSTQISNSYNNIGIAYMNKEDFKQALNYFNAAYKGYSKLPKENNANDMLMLNLGDVYMKMAIKENRREYYDKAMAYYKDRLESYKKGGPNERHSQVLTKIGQIMCALGECREAMKFLNRGLEMARQVKNKGAIMEASLQYSKALEQTGENALALQYMHLYNETKDSLINQRNRESTEQMAALYNSQQKDREIEKLNTEKEIKDAKIGRQRMVMISFIGGFLLVLCLGFVLLSRYNLKKKANRKLEDAYYKIEIKNRQITDSINYARRIQNAILPPSEILSQNFKDVFVFYVPKDIVSGDFYWFSKAKGKSFFVVADCTGHGVPGALMSMIGNTLLNEIVNQKGICDPGEILFHLDAGVGQALRQDETHVLSQDDGMDVSVCVMDEKDKGKICFASANHIAFLKTGNDIQEIRGDIYSIGGGLNHQAKMFTSKEITVQENDFIIMSTDGFYDQFGGKENRKFMISKFEELITHTDLSLNAESSLRSSFENWKGDQRQTDDILVAGFRI
jgi:serine phosphatase RsbU (regulator of sigma subunit)